MPQTDMNRQELSRAHLIKHLPCAKYCSRCWETTVNRAGKIPAFLELIFSKQEINSNYEKYVEYTVFRWNGEK